MQDVRWKQRLDNYRRALQTLTEALALSKTRELSQLEQQGLIQGFEFTHELAWNLLKDYLGDQGIVGLIGSRDATRSAFKNELIGDGQTWMQMIEARNLTSHSYNPDVAKAVVKQVLEQFYEQFMALAATFHRLAGKE